MLSCRVAVSPLSLSFDDHLERLRSGRVSEGVVGIEDAVELKTMGNQAFWVDLVRSDGLEEHRYGNGVDQPCGDGDIAVPEALQVESHLLPMHPDIGDGAARRDEFFAQLKKWPECL